MKKTLAIWGCLLSLMYVLTACGKGSGKDTIVLPPADDVVQEIPAD